MKTLLLVVTMFFAMPAKAADIVGFATLHHLNATSHQPGDCASREPRSDGLACVDFVSWNRYELRDLKDLSTGELVHSTAVFATHVPRQGRWLVVLEKLGPEDAAAFDAEYVIVDGGGTFEVACLKAPLESMLPGGTADRVGAGEEDSYCYDVQTVRVPEL